MRTFLRLSIANRMEKFRYLLVFGSFSFFFVTSKMKLKQHFLRKNSIALPSITPTHDFSILRNFIRKRSPATSWHK